jgi:HD-like signal output (HDOD) protein
MNKFDPQRIMTTLANISHVGTTPEISIKLFELVKDNDADIAEIAKLILHDPTITAQLLKLSNSAFYSRGKTITTVNEAIIILGLDTIKKLILAIEMIGLFHNRHDQSNFNSKTFYKSSLAGAMLCNKLAMERNYTDTETPFICGLLRDYGILVARQYFPDIFLEVNTLANEKKWSFAEAFKTVGMVEHRYVAYLLFMYWCLPTRILYAFEAPSSDLQDYNATVRNRNLVRYTDCVLKKYAYGQWEKYSDPPEVQSKELAFDKEFLDKTTAAIFKEVDELVPTLMV